MEEKVVQKTKNKKKPVIIGIVVIVIILAIGIILFVGLGNIDKFRSVVVNDYSGSIVLERDQNKFEIAKDMKLIPNDEVSVGDTSLLDILVDDDKHIAVRSMTKFSIDAVGNQQKGLVTINVTEGKTYIKIDNSLEPGDGFQVVTPNATISVRGTTFTVDYDSKRGVTRVACVEGKVNVVSNSGDETDLLSGEVVEVVDVMNVSALTSQEMDAIEKVFAGEYFELEFEPEIELKSEQTTENGEEELSEETEEPLVCMTAEEIMGAKAGDIVTYGTYAITYRWYNMTVGTGEVTTEIIERRTQNKETPIEWIVLENDGSRVTLLSKYILDNIPYHPFINEDYTSPSPTWENSYIREWLNNDFYNVAFTETEKAYIQITTCVNEDNKFFGMPGGNNVLTKPGKAGYPAGGNDTEDKVYLLSLGEIEDYFGITTEDYSRVYSNRELGITAEIDHETYVTLCNEKSGGILSTEYISGNVCRWLLRSPGLFGYYPAEVGCDGYVNMEGYLHENYDSGVRPVIRIGIQ